MFPSFVHIFSKTLLVCERIHPPTLGMTRCQSFMHMDIPLSTLMDILIFTPPYLILIYSCVLKVLGIYYYRFPLYAALYVWNMVLKLLHVLWSCSCKMTPSVQAPLIEKLYAQLHMNSSNINPHSTNRMLFSFKRY